MLNEFVSFKGSCFEWIWYNFVDNFQFLSLLYFFVSTSSDVDSIEGKWKTFGEANLQKGLNYRQRWPK